MVVSGYRQREPGFTIVELLIVIVVIGILAAITIVAYNGIQQRGRNAQTANAVNVYKKALAMYLTENGSYPIQGDVCLGGGYPDLDGGSVSEDCSAANGVVSYRINASMDTALTKYIGSTKPTPNTKMFTDEYNRTQGGIHFRYITAYTLDGVSNPYWLVYKSEGTGPCPVGPIPTQSGNAFTSTTPSTGYSSVWTSESVQCIVPLPNPT